MKQESDRPGKKGHEDVICEFFGLQITTKNKNVARVLRSDVHEILQLDVRDVSTYLSRKPKETTETTHEPEPGAKRIESNWRSLSAELGEINDLLNKDKEEGED